MKTCVRCKQIKSLDEFYNCKKSKDGRTTYCAMCCRNAVKSTLQKAEDKGEEYLELQRQKKRDAYKNKYSHAAKLRYRRKREEIIEYQKQWHQDNRENVSKRRSRFYAVVANRVYANAYNRYVGVIRAKRGYSPVPFSYLIGCNKTYLFEHLSLQFKEGMTGDNYGEWEIDHIRPICSFDLTKDEDVIQCFHYTNMQPLWREDNQAKGTSWSG